MTVVVPVLISTAFNDYIKISIIFLRLVRVSRVSGYRSPIEVIRIIRHVLKNPPVRANISLLVIDRKMRIFQARRGRHRRHPLSKRILAAGVFRKRDVDRFAMISRGDLHTNAFDFAFDSFLIQLRNTAVRFRSMRMPGQAFLRLVAVGNDAVFLAKSPLAKNRCQHPIMNNKRKHPCRVIYALVQQLVPTYQTLLLSSFATLCSPFLANKPRKDIIRNIGCIASSAHKSERFDFNASFSANLLSSLPFSSLWPSSSFSLHLYRER